MGFEKHYYNLHYRSDKMANDQFKQYVGRTMTDETGKERGEPMSATTNLQDELFNSVGLYSSEQINKSKYESYSRFGRVLDPHNKLNDTREYLFFVKPDLHICYNSSASNFYTSKEKRRLQSAVNGLVINPQLQDNIYFSWLIAKRPDVVRQLQYSLDKKNPFTQLLSFTVSNNLDLPSVDSTTLDTPNTIFGSNIEYLKDSETSDENPSFSLEFVDSKKLEVYHFFKAYSEYHKVRKSGLVTPPSSDYYRYKRLHNTMGVFKFLVDEDMETIRYFAYYWGVFPTNVPREAFSDPNFENGLTFTVNFKAAFVEDNDPRILSHFNGLMNKVIGHHDFTNKDWMSVLKESKADFSQEIMGQTVIPNNLSTGRIINGELARGALVDMSGREFKLRWYK
jgi:hypothetical protein